MCFYVFPLSFKMRIVWRLSRFRGEGPCLCTQWLCFICPGKRDNNALTGRQVFATRLTMALPSQEQNEKSKSASLLLGRWYWCLGFYYIAQGGIKSAVPFTMIIKTACPKKIKHSNILIKFLALYRKYLVTLPTFLCLLTRVCKSRWFSFSLLFLRFSWTAPRKDQEVSATSIS